MFIRQPDVDIWSLGVWARYTNLGVTNIYRKIEAMHMNEITVSHLEE